MFYLHANQDTLYQSITRNIDGLPKTNINQLSMDGPNANWQCLRNLLQQGRKMMNQLTEIGSCSLHIVSASLNAGINASDWEVNEVMKAMWKILSNSPAWRDIYLKSSISEKLPLRFCST